MNFLTCIFTISLFVSCCNINKTVKQDEHKFTQNKVELDSLLTAYEYKCRGNKKNGLGDRLGAINDYTRAIILNNKYDTAYYNRGFVKSALGYKADAIADYDSVLLLNLKYIKAYNARANAKYDIGDTKGAFADYNKAIMLKPDFISAYINRGVTKYEMGDYEGALSDCRLAIEHCAPDADLYNNYGHFLYDLKRFKESAEAYGDGIKYFPEDYKLYYGRGLARNQSGDKKGACEDWRTSINLGCFEANALLPLCDDCETDKAPK